MFIRLRESHQNKQIAQPTANGMRLVYFMQVPKLMWVRNDVAELAYDCVLR